jgi:large subunit ribosomal protein L14
MGSVVRVVDNTGVMRVKCIKVLSGSDRYLIGEKIIGSVQRVKSFRRFKRGYKVRAYIVGLKKWSFRSDGSYIRFGKTTCVIVGRKGMLRASRVKAPVMKEFKDKIEVRTLGVAIKTV